MAENDTPTDWLDDIAMALRLFTRLPLPASDDTIGQGVWRAMPVVGIIVGIVGAMVMMAASWLTGDTLLAAIAGVAASVMATGCFHEDGLADTADGLGGGWSRERKLDIMRDSRLGSYGAAAMVFALLLRTTLLAVIIERLDVIAASAIAIAMETLSRAAGVWFAHYLPPARAEGASRSAGQPTAAALQAALVIAGLVVLVLVWPAASASAMILAVVMVVITSWSFAGFAKRQIGGQTGDVTGACQQIALIAGLAGIVIATHIIR